MLAALYTLLALVILGTGIYAAFVGAVAFVVGFGFRFEVRLVRATSAGVTIAGLALYLLGSSMLLDALELTR